MIKLGITGGIGSGKSTVSSIFQVLDIPVYIADNESKRLTEESPIIRKQLIKLFNDNNLYQNNKLNKPLLASYIFKDKETLSKVNSIIHPIVFNHFVEWTDQNKANKIIALESAILFETNMDKLIDYTILVSAPLEKRIAQVMLRDNTSREKVIERINNQLPEEDKIKKSNFIIENDESFSLINQCLDLINKIK